MDELAQLKLENEELTKQVEMLEDEAIQMKKKLKYLEEKMSYGRSTPSSFADLTLEQIQMLKSPKGLKGDQW